MAARSMAESAIEHPEESAMQTPQVSAAAGTRSYYNDVVVRRFAIMTVVWGIVAMLVGAFIARCAWQRACC
jgi:cbb3-type cytochrome oxidase subunit 1